MPGAERTTSISPDTRRIWRAARAPVGIVVLIIAVGVVVTMLRDTSEGGALDARSATPAGSRALAQLLAERGVDVEPVQRVSDATSQHNRDATVLVTYPDLLSADQVRLLAERSGALIMIAPSELVVSALDKDIHTAAQTSVRTRQPDCDLAAARAAGPATIGGIAYAGPADATLCYRSGDAGTLLRVTHDGTPITLLGTGVALMNTALADEGNAALVMRLLGGNSRLVWYTPSATDPGLRTDERTMFELLPAGWTFGLIQVGIAAVLLALWRARRLGPVVSEAIPVVVRAAETTEGRARLYRRARATGHAADALRAAARARIASTLGLPSTAEPDAIIAAVASRSGRERSDVYPVLYGPAPAGDAELVRLADALDRMEDDIR